MNRVVVEEVEVDLAARGLDVMELVHQSLSVLLGCKRGEERIGQAGQLFDATVGEFVIRAQGCSVDLGVDRHRFLPLRRRAVAREPDQEPNQLQIGGQWHVHRGRRAEHRAQAVLEHCGFGQRKRQCGGQPTGVAPARVGRDAVAIDDGDLDSTFLQEPGRRQSDNTRTDHDHTIGALTSSHDALLLQTLLEPRRRSHPALLSSMNRRGGKRTGRSATASGNALCECTALAWEANHSESIRECTGTFELILKY